MRKGITPIISIIVLLLITVALAGVAWTYLSGFLGTQMQTITVPPNGAYCTTNNIKVVIANTGTEILASLILGEVNGAEHISQPDAGLDVALASKDSVTLTFTCDEDGIAGCTNGDYTVTISTAGSSQNIPVYCNN